MLLTATEERKLAEDDKKLPEEKLGRSYEQQTHATNNTNTSFAEEKEEVNKHAKNFKWRMPYGLSIHKLYKEKEVKKDKVKIFKNILGVEKIC